MKGILLLAASLLMSLLAGYFTATSYTQVAEGVTLFRQPLPMRTFEFMSQHQQSVTQASLRDRNKLLFFGYTYCPDICPMTLARLSRWWKTLPQATREQWQVILVSVDPDRDTPESLQPYMRYFSSDFMALTGSNASLASLATDLNGFYSRVDGTAEMPYLMDHSANVVILDRDWRYRGFIVPPHSPEQLMSVVRQAL